MVLEDYKDLVGVAAAFVTCCQMFSGVFICKDIYKNGNTNKIPSIPFTGGFVLSILLYQHAQLLNDEPMGAVNAIGFILNIGYLIFYWFWTSENKKWNFYKELAVGITLVSIFLGYVKIENPEKVEFRFGLIVTAILMSLIASPLFSLGEVMRTKSTETLPFPMIFSGFIVTAHWLLYGIIIKNNLVIFQNGFGFFLCFVQLMLFVIFPSHSEKQQNGNVKSTSKNKAKKAD